MLQFVNGGALIRGTESRFLSGGVTKLVHRFAGEVIGVHSLRGVQCLVQRRTDSQATRIVQAKAA